jgi:hypothetical protein
VPKKRGPKTDVLEALLKRVDGLEKRIHTEVKSDDLDDLDPSTAHESSHHDSNVPIVSPSQSRHPIDIAPTHANSTSHANQLMSPVEPRCADIFSGSGPVTCANPHQRPYANSFARATTRYLLYQNTW